MQIKFCSKKTFYLQPIPQLWVKDREIIQQTFKQTYKKVIKLSGVSDSDCYIPE